MLAATFDPSATVTFGLAAFAAVWWLARELKGISISLEDVATRLGQGNARTDDHEKRLDGHEGRIGTLENRIETIEQKDNA